MSPTHWFLFINIIILSLGFSFYTLWVKWKYAMPNHPTGLTGCEVARLVLDRMGVIHVAVTPVEPPHSPEDYLSSEGLFLEKSIYEGRGIQSLVIAARQSFLKGQLSDMTFWIHLKKRMTFMAQLAVMLGWLCLLGGLFFSGAAFFANFGLGAFGVVMLIAIFDLPFELEVGEKTSKIVREIEGLAPYEFTNFKKMNQAVSFTGMSYLIQVPVQMCARFLKRK